MKMKMKIKFKESINSELTCIGLQPGMFTSVDSVNEITGAAYFKHWHNGLVNNCVVWPVDYELVKEEEVSQDPDPVKQPTVMPENVTLSIAQITNALDAMYWCFAPFLDSYELSDKPWITNLMKSYNDIVSTLPSPWDLQYERVDY